MIENYASVLEPHICKELISSFEDNVAYHERFDNVCMKFTQLNLTQHGLNIDLQRVVYNKIVAVTALYREQCQHLPEVRALEEFRIKKYNPQDDLFDWHVDVTDRETAKRFLAIQFYLNTVDEGGRTCFEFTRGGQSVKIDPIEGNVLCFPPNFMFPHCGQTPVSEPKYILSTYLHYDA